MASSGSQDDWGIQAAAAALVPSRGQDIVEEFRKRADTPGRIQTLLAFLNKLEDDLVALKGTLLDLLEMGKRDSEEWVRIVAELVGLWLLPELETGDTIQAELQKTVTGILEHAQKHGEAPATDAILQHIPQPGGQPGGLKLERVSSTPASAPRLGRVLSTGSRDGLSRSNSHPNEAEGAMSPGGSRTGRKRPRSESQADGEEALKGETGGVALAPYFDAYAATLLNKQPRYGDDRFRSPHMTPQLDPWEVLGEVVEKDRKGPPTNPGSSYSHSGGLLGLGGGLSSGAHPLARPSPVSRPFTSGRGSSPGPASASNGYNRPQPYSGRGGAPPMSGRSMAPGLARGPSPYAPGGAGGAAPVVRKPLGAGMRVRAPAAKGGIKALDLSDVQRMVAGNKATNAKPAPIKALPSTAPPSATPAVSASPDEAPAPSPAHPPAAQPARIPNLSSANTPLQRTAAAPASIGQPASLAPAPAQGESRRSPEEIVESMFAQSNALKPEDRARTLQFVENSELSDLPDYKFKVHEEVVRDPATGDPIRETTFITLDYRTKVWRKSKRSKRGKAT